MTAARTAARGSAVDVFGQLETDRDSIRDTRHGLLAAPGLDRSGFSVNPLRHGLNVAEGRVVFEPVADLFKLPCTDPEDLLADLAT